jgi:hypothetical protein
MPTAYLVKTVSAQIDANGNATCVLKPDVGQYWAPSLVRVATRVTPQNTSFSVSSTATLYHGSVSVLDSTTYIDNTYQGSTDSSSVIAGTIVLFGEAITCAWSQGTTGDVAIMTVYGRSADNLVELQDQLSPVPGTRFAGGSGNAMQWEYNNFSLTSGNLSSSPPVFTLPGDALCEIIYAEITTTNSATVANRIVGLDAKGIIQGANATLMRAINGTLRTASLTSTYVWGQGIGLGSGGVFSAPIPLRCILLPGFQITVENINGAVGDTWTNFQVNYRQYQTLTTVSYT